MRDDRKKLIWNVAIEPFFLMRHPVTQEQYFDLTGMNPSSFNGPRRPVEGVSWFDAVKYCNLASRAVLHDKLPIQSS